jgi:GNAT superfamily N-acetyltransferase
MLMNQGRARRCAFGVFDRDACRGAALLEWDTEQNTHLGEVEISVPPQHRRRDVGTALLERVHDQANQIGLTTLVTEVNAAAPDWPGLHFAAHHGFETVHTEDRLVLDLPIDANQLDAFINFSDAPCHGFTLTSWSGSTPESLRHAMAALQTGMNAEVPAGDRDADAENVTPESLAAADQRFADRGYRSIRTMALTPDGQPAGYSHLFAMEGDPANAIQGGTYVLSPHRGHRIGTLLKSVNIRTLQNDRPDVQYIHTWTAEQNSPMQAINAEFGFRSVELMHEMQRGSRLT